MHLARRSRTAIIAAISAAALAIAGCSTSNQDDTGFWKPFQLSALEVDPPATLQELTDRSTLIVEGTITGVEQGPSTLPEEGPVLNTTALVVQVDSALEGTTGDQVVKVLVAPSSPQDALTVSPPSGKYLCFLTTATQGGYFTPTAVSGVVGETATDGLQTVIDPSQSDLLETSPEGELDGLRDLLPVVRSLAR